MMVIKFIIVWSNLKSNKFNPILIIFQNKDELLENRESDFNEEQGYTKVAEKIEEDKSYDSLTKSDQNKKNISRINENK